MFLVNSREASFAAAFIHPGRSQSFRRQPFFRSYGRCFAEFLHEGSPDHLAAFTQLSTCVGLRYGFRTALVPRHSLRSFAGPNKRRFSRQHGPRASPSPKGWRLIVFDVTGLLQQGPGFSKDPRLRTPTTTFHSRCALPRCVTPCHCAEVPEY